ncbi:immunoglobulin-like domain-containing protein [Mycoplasma sp. P36-A1]|uniref:immunoglobulin-like domain-containing protein n=1 Tax=Mycoplasma sp. P36-A1 TaxID=3252900 RepID=UPI003C2DF83A
MKIIKVKYILCISIIAILVILRNNIGTKILAVNTTEISKEKPVLTIPKTLTIKVNDSLPVYKAKDKEDGDIEAKLTNNIDTSVANIIPIVYYAIDKDGNQVIAEQLLTITSSELVMGKDYSIYAKSYTQAKSMFKQSNTSIVRNAKATVFENKTGKIIENTLSVDRKEYKDVYGDSYITFTTSRDRSISNKVKVTTDKGELPKLTLEEYTKINIHESFDTLKDVVVKDEEDEYTLDSLKPTIKGSVNTEQAGLYPLEYSYTDKDSNTVTVNRVVLVKDDSIIEGENFVLSAYSFNMNNSDTLPTNEEIIDKAKIKVYDKKTGNITDADLSINTNNLSMNNGTYGIEISLNKEATTKTTINMIVSNKQSPKLNVSRFLEINMGETLKDVYAQDQEDGDIKADLANDIDINKPGIYNLVYKASDKDGNEVEANQIAVVKNNEINSGNNYIIKANDYTVDINDVNTDIDAIIKSANIQVFNKLDGTISKEKVGININDYAAIAGKYEVNAYVENDKTSQIKFNITVDPKNPPTIKVAEYTEITIGSKFNPLENVQVDDQEDGSLNVNDVVVIGTVNTTIAGVYKLDYEVLDKDQNKGFATQVVVVKDDSIIIDNDEIYVVNNPNITTSIAKSSDKDILKNIDIKVYNKNTAEVLSKEFVVDRTNLKEEEKTYSVDVSLKDNPKIKTTVYVTIDQKKSPYLELDKFLQLNVNDKLPKIKAIDNEDKEINAKIDTTIDTTKVGVYPVIYSATDSDGNKVSANQVIVVKDNTISIGNEYIISANDFTILARDSDIENDMIIKNANIQVYNKQTGVVETTPLEINLKGFNQKENKYEIEALVTKDKTTKISIIINIDIGTLPEIKTALYQEVNLNDKFDPLADVEITDKEDGAIKVSEDNVKSQVDTTKAGVYKLNYEVTDTDTNKVSVTKVVVVKDTNLEVGNDYILTANKTTTKNKANWNEQDILNNTEAKVYDKKTGSILNEKTVVDATSLSNEVKEYPLNISVEKEPTTTLITNVKVEDNAMPQFTIPKYIEINKGETLNEVNAKDQEDGEIPAKMSNKIDTNVPGVYKAYYSATDKENNRVEFTQIIVVKDKSISVGDNYILKANDFTVRMKDFSLDGKDVIKTAKIKAYNKQTGEAINNRIEILLNGYNQSPGSYELGIYLPIESTNILKINATVDPKEIPEVTIPEFTQINVNDSFDNNTNVIINDKEDGSIKPTITGSVDTTKPGVYVLDYEVKDSDLNVINNKQVVVVKDDKINIGTDYIISAQDFNLRPSQVDTNILAIKKAANLVVYDKKTGIETKDAVSVNVNDYNTKVGSYKIAFTLDDQTTKEITANVETGELPTINIPQLTELNLNDKFDNTSNLSVSDKEDGTIKATITGSVDTTKPGVYPVTYTTVDKDGNKVDSEQLVVVKGENVTVGTDYIIVANNIDLDSKDLNDQNIISKSNLKVYDKKTNKEVSDQVVIDKSSFNNQTGTYDIKVAIGSEQVIIKADVKVGEAPIVDIPAILEINANDTLSDVEVSDKEDGTIKATITGSVDTTKPGVYPVTYTTVDKDGNKVDSEQLVVVKGENITVGTDYIIVANNIDLDSKDLNDQNIISKSNLKVYDKKTNKEVSDQVVIDKSSFNNQTGTYDIKVAIGSEQVIIKADVKVGEAPIVDIPAILEINANDTLSDVEVSDKEDGTIKATITGNVDTTKPGVYPVTYTTVDKDGNKVDSEQLVVVKGENVTVGTDYIIVANNIDLDSKDLNDQNIISKSNLKVYDKKTNKEVSDQVVVDKSSFNNQTGTYDIKVAIGSEQVIIKADVKVGEAPIVDIPAILEINANDTLSDVEVSDKEDGTIKATITGSVDTTKAGVYPVTYTTVDKDGNKVDSEQLVVVKGENITVGTDYIIVANNIDLDSKDLNDQNIISKSNLKVYDKKTNKEVSDQVVIDKSSFNNQTGTYDIKVAIGSEQVIIKADVKVGEAPIVDIPAILEINANDTLSDVEVSDKEDGTIKATITGSVDTTKPGVYPVTYTTVDKDGNKVDSEQLVVVKGENVTVGTDYIIVANNIDLDSKDLNDQNIISKSNLKVYDKKTNKEVSDQVVVDKSSFNNQTGTYDIKVAIGSEQVIIKADVTVDNQSVDKGKPAKIVTENYQEVSLNSKYSYLKNLKVSDKEDGIISNDKVTYKSDLNTKIAGVYNVQYKVIDSDLNETVFTKVILVKDSAYVKDNNLIINAYSFEINSDNLDLSIDNLLKLSKVRVYDISKLEWIKNPAVKIISNNIMNKPGTYQITLSINPKITINVIINNSTTGNDKNSNVKNPKTKASTAETTKSNLPKSGTKTIVQIVVLFLLFVALLAFKQKRNRY